MEKYDNDVTNAEAVWNEPVSVLLSVWNHPVVLDVEGYKLQASSVFF